jgi:hypothetical protein
MPSLGCRCLSIVAIPRSSLSLDRRCLSAVAEPITIYNRLKLLRGRFIEPYMREYTVKDSAPYNPRLSLSFSCRCRSIVTVVPRLLLSFGRYRLPIVAVFRSVQPLDCRYLSVVAILPSSLSFDRYRPSIVAVFRSLPPLDYRYPSVIAIFPLSLSFRYRYLRSRLIARR